MYSANLKRWASKHNLRQFQEAAHLQPVENNQLDIVIALADQHLAVAVGGRADGSWRLRQAHQSYCTLVHNCRACALQEREDDFDVLPLLIGVCAADLH